MFFFFSCCVTRHYIFRTSREGAQVEKVHTKRSFTQHRKQHQRNQGTSMCLARPNSIARVKSRLKQHLLLHRSNASGLLLLEEHAALLHGLLHFGALGRLHRYKRLIVSAINHQPCRQLLSNSQLLSKLKILGTAPSCIPPHHRVFPLTYCNVKKA